MRNSQPQSHNWKGSTFELQPLTHIIRKAHAITTLAVGNLSAVLNSNYLCVCVCVCFLKKLLAPYCSPLNVGDFTEMYLFNPKISMLLNSNPAISVQKQFVLIYIKTDYFPPCIVPVFILLKQKLMKTIRRLKWGPNFLLLSRLATIRYRQVVSDLNESGKPQRN